MDRSRTAGCSRPRVTGHDLRRATSVRCSESRGAAGQRTGHILAKETLADFNPAATKQVRVEHELEQERDVRLKDVERRSEHCAAAEHLGQAGFVPRMNDVDLEVGDVADVVAVKGDSFAKDDERDVLCRLPLFVLRRQCEPHGPVKRRAESSDIVTDCEDLKEGVRVSVVSVGARARKPE
jgi:hypothetical protein